MTAFQASLLDWGEDVHVGELGSSVRRTPLERGAWIDVRPHWIEGADALFERLLEAVPWHAERRHMYDRVVDVPRLLKFYDEDEELPDPVLVQAREALNAHYEEELGEPFRTAGMCLYRDGRDSVAWHGDTIGRGSTHDTMVAIVSVGTPRPLLLRPRGGGGRCCGTSWATATSSSWAGAASAPGSTRFPSRPRRSAPASASSSARAACAEREQEAEQEAGRARAGASRARAGASRRQAGGWQGAVGRP